MKKIILIILLSISCLCIGFLVGKNYKEAKKNNETENNIKETSLSQEEFLTKVAGEYLYKDESGAIYVMYIKSNNKASYYQLYTDSIIETDIISFDYVNGNLYTLTFHADAYEGLEQSYQEQLFSKTIDISKLSENILLLDNQEYKKYNGEYEDWDAKAKVVE